MTAVKILQYPDPRLSTKAIPVTEFDENLQRQVKDMCDTYFAAENCAALASTQLDIANPLHITVINITGERGQFLTSKNVQTVTGKIVTGEMGELLCLVNGEIVESEGEMQDGEACMSVSGVYEKLTRASKVKVRGQDHHGNPLEFVVEGFMAKCLQHELDHLKGTIFIDRLSPLKRGRIDSKFKKWLRKK